MARADGEPADIAANRERQRELYGSPLGDRVRTLTGALGITQARLARALGVSPAMLSQLVSARRVKIGDPAVLARLLMLDQRCQGLRTPPEPRAVEVLLADVARVRWHWTAPRVGERRRRRAAADGAAIDALRGIAEPARLAAAAAALGPAFPELADALRQAAGRPRV
ncbi:XRE family transcriptional regulator [Pseudonocardia nigra]|uniref:XRE family transcriptional regulator n=1 Tax=Pseudonocardia nigra TaxID=1921578 RepID=UPI001C5DA35D|nr:XRE family transcriptional regulator [Pseudonocardia nigra]